MKLQDFGGTFGDNFFKQILEWSRKKITFDDNLDCQILNVSINTTQTEIGHALGRVPKLILECASYPAGTAGISFTKAPTNNKIFLTRTVAGQATLILM